jgi:transposase
MANHLTMALVDSVFTLHRRGWSRRRIARELGIHREAVARYLQTPATEPKPAVAPLGSDLTGPEAKPAIAPPGSPTVPVPPSPTDPSPDTPARPRIGRPSDWEPWRALILAKLDQGLSAQRIFQDLVAEHHFPGSYYSVRRFVQNLEQATPLPFRRLECGPGEEARIDFGTGAPLVPGGAPRRRTHVFRIVLGHSRKAYSEAVTRQTTDDFLRRLENALWAFGGVPQRLALDNLRAAVVRADWFEPGLNPKVRAFAAHYGTVFLPTRPYTPRPKGKVERGVDYVRENALKGRTFAGLEEQNQFLRDWEQHVADTRVHGTTRRQVGKLFTAVERAALLPLPAGRFPSFQEARRAVHRDGHVEPARAFYSVPPEYPGRRVRVRWDGRLVRIFNERLEPVAVRVQQPPGRFSTHQAHLAPEKIGRAEHGAAWLLAKVARLGAQATAWARALMRTRGPEGLRVLPGLLSPAGRHSPAAIDRARGLAHGHGCYRLRTVRDPLDRATPKPESLPWLEDHPLIRSLAAYGRVVRDPVAKECEA